LRFLSLRLNGRIVSLGGRSIWVQLHAKRFDNIRAMYIPGRLLLVNGPREKKEVAHLRRGFRDIGPSGDDISGGWFGIFREWETCLSFIAGGLFLKRISRQKLLGGRTSLQGIDGHGSVSGQLRQTSALSLAYVSLRWELRRTTRDCDPV